MQESKGRESSTENNSESDATTADDATSKETVSDIEENEPDVEPESSRSDRGPAPDGALDESEESKGAGPM